jgi:hypothetical protein
VVPVLAPGLRGANDAGPWHGAASPQAMARPTTLAPLRVISTLCLFFTYSINFTPKYFMSLIISYFIVAPVLAVGFFIIRDCFRVMGYLLVRCHFFI